jgi:hypothetical protein
MPLTLRSTKLETSPVYARLKDYTVFEGGTEIGRIFERRPPAPPDALWVWSIFGVGRPGWGRVKTDGRTATFEDAKSAFRTAYEQWRA